MNLHVGAADAALLLFCLIVYGLFIASGVHVYDVIHYHREDK